MGAGILSGENSVQIAPFLTKFWGKISTFQKFFDNIILYINHTWILFLQVMGRNLSTIVCFKKFGSGY